MTDAAHAPPPDLYVGYLPPPRRHRRAMRLVVPTVLWGLCALAALTAGAMHNAGSGTWDTSDTRSFVGTIIARPYPALLARTDDDDTGSSPTRTIFLVEPGKVGVRDGLDGLAGRSARAEGFVLERDGRRVLELLPDDDGVATIDDGRAAMIVSEPLGEATLRGEIVDYKCYLGAMKPGHGLTHRGCAVLCISGGIPPALVVTGPGGDRAFYILRTPDGARLNDEVLPHVAVPVEVTGELVREADTLYLETTPARIRRL